MKPAMTNTLFRNVWRSFWGQRARSLLIVFSLAAGIFAVGTTAGAQSILDLRCILMSHHWDLCWDRVFQSGYLRGKTAA